ncbi:DBH-like monooxygenase protein 2 [Pleurodeles waltl]|uniref:DBH-like monooxygenase protein 2 n=1 Tax=Pleurodeles waltl TaxID=8319 RepID=UPI00370975E3
MRLILLLLSLLQSISATEKKAHHPPHIFTRLLDPQGSMVLHWFYDYSTEEITFELEAQTTGWVAFGLSTKEELKGTDMVIGGVFLNKTVYFTDGHVDEDWPPVVDEKQNYHLLSLTENETATTMKFSRKFRTCDPNDLDITNDTLRVSSAYGLDDTLHYDEEHRFVKSICLMEIVQPVVMPKIYYTHDIKLNDFPVPEEDTTYACTFVPMPAVRTKHHLFMYVPHVDTNLVHHILIYACPNDTYITTEVGECYGGDATFSQCSQVIFGWAVGGSPFFLPPNAGIPLGTPLDPYYVRIEVHFSNFDAIPGLVSNSGILIYYTPELREHDAGIIQYGVFTFPIHFIPPGAEAYKTYGLCHTDAFHEVNGNHVEDMHIISYLNHGHLTVRGIRVLHYRNGTFLGSLEDDNGYDFRLQEIRHFKEDILTIKVGDVIVVECTQNTVDRETVTFGGTSTLNEMCLSFLFYYPRTNISKCWGFTDVIYVINELDLEPTTE